MSERLADPGEEEEVRHCECPDGRNAPGRVLIAVFCGVCDGYITYIGGDIDRQVEELGKVQRVIHAIAATKAAVGAQEARSAALEEEGRAWDRRHRHRNCSHEDYEPGSVTMTEVWGDEGFRPFG